MTRNTSSSDQEHYLSTAAVYDRRIDAILPQSEAFFSSCLSFIKKGPITLLELGSGTGFATSLIRARNSQAEITGIDHSPEMIQYARQKPDLTTVEICEQDIRDPWPQSQYDVIMTTLCFHHIPESDRCVLLHRVYQALNTDGIFICGDIIRPESLKAEEIYRTRWIQAMKEAKMPPADIDNIISSRKENYSDMETIASCTRKMHDAGFSEVLMPYRHEISAVFIGMK